MLLAPADALQRFIEQPWALAPTLGGEEFKQELLAQIRHNLPKALTTEPRVVHSFGWQTETK
jgi:hypothetical protein